MHTEWDHVAVACSISRTVQQRFNVFTTFATDIMLLSLLFVGVMWNRSRSVLWEFLYRQVRVSQLVAEGFDIPCRLTISKGLVWLLLATVAELPPVVSFFVRPWISSSYTPT